MNQPGLSRERVPQKAGRRDEWKRCPLASPVTETAGGPAHEEAPPPDPLTGVQGRACAGDGAVQRARLAHGASAFGTGSAHGQCPDVAKIGNFAHGCYGRALLVSIRLATAVAQVCISATWCRVSAPGCSASGNSRHGNDGMKLRRVVLQPSNGRSVSFQRIASWSKEGPVLRSCTAAPAVRVSQGNAGQGAQSEQQGRSDAIMTSPDDPTASCDRHRRLPDTTCQPGRHRGSIVCLVDFL